MANGRIKIALPQTGRMAADYLRMLASEGMLDPEWSSEAAKAMENDGRLGERDAAEAVEELRGRGIGGLKTTYDPGKDGHRVGLLSKEAEVEGIPVVFHGTDWPSVSGIREETSELAVIRLDDLTASMLPYLKPGSRRIRKGFGNYGQDMGWINEEIESENSTDVRVVGGAGLEDYAGLFVLVHKHDEIAETARQYSVFYEFCKRAERIYAHIGHGDQRELHKTGNALQDLLSKREVAVKGRHQGLAYAMLDRTPYDEEEPFLSRLSGRIYSRIFQGRKNLEVRAFSSENVAEEVSSGSVIGLDVLRTGRTAAENGLVAIGPLMRTASVTAVDKTKLESNGDVARVCARLAGRSDYSEGFLRWENDLLDRHEKNVFSVDLGEVLSSRYWPEY